MSDRVEVTLIDRNGLVTLVWAFVSLLVAAYLRFGDTAAVLELASYTDLVFWGWWFLAFFGPVLALVGFFLFVFAVIFALAVLFGERQRVDDRRESFEAWFRSDEGFWSDDADRGDDRNRTEVDDAEWVDAEWKSVEEGDEGTEGIPPDGDRK